MYSLFLHLLRGMFTTPIYTPDGRVGAGGNYMAVFPSNYRFTLATMSLDFILGSVSYGVFIRILLLLFLKIN